MKRILDRIKCMTLFQKIQLISAVIPYWSCPFVVIATYVICAKKKLSFFSFFIRFFAYFILQSFTINFVSPAFAKYIIGLFISLAGNYALLCLQMKEKE